MYRRGVGVAVASDGLSRISGRLDAVDTRRRKR